MKLACSAASNAHAMQALQDDLPARNTRSYLRLVEAGNPPPPPQPPEDNERLGMLAVLAVMVVFFLAGVNAAFVGGLVHN